MSKPYLRLVAPRGAATAKPQRTPVRRPERLSELVWQAAQAVAPRAGGSVTLQLSSLQEQPEDPLVVLNLLCRKQSTSEFDGVTARVRIPGRGRQAAKALLGPALEQYGGTRFVALTTGGSAHQSEGLDATVCFPHRLQFVAHNVVTVPHLLLVDQARTYSEILRLIGVAHSVKHSTFRARRFQLRRQPTRDQLVAAFGAALEQCQSASLYAAELPLRQAMRAEQFGSRRGWFELTLSRGLSGSAPCTLLDCDEMGAFVERHCGVAIARLQWQVSARLWMRDADSPGKPPSGVSR